MPSKNWTKKHEGAINRPILFDTLEDLQIGNNGCFYVIHEKCRRGAALHDDNPIKHESALLMLCLEDICALGGKLQVRLGSYGNKRSRTVSDKITEVLSRFPITGTFCYLL